MSSDVSMTRGVVSTAQARSKIRYQKQELDGNLSGGEGVSAGPVVRLSSLAGC